MFTGRVGNEFSRSMGLRIPLAIPVNVLDKVGFKKVPGLRVAPGFDKNK